MKKNYYLVFGLVAAIVVSAVVVFTPNTYNTVLMLADAPTPYIPSDISKSNPLFQKGTGEISLVTTDIEDVKDQVTITIKGKVVSIGDPVIWTDSAGNTKGSIPVEILVEKSYKGKIKSGEVFTLYLDSIKEGGKFYIQPFEATFEEGEEVIVHAALGNIPGISNPYFVKLGEFGKYKIIDDKAYNEKFPYGVNSEFAGQQGK